MVIAAAPPRMLTCFLERSKTAETCMRECSCAVCTTLPVPRVVAEGVWLRHASTWLQLVIHSLQSSVQTQTMSRVEQ